MLARELRNFQRVTYEKGETIFNAGEVGKHAYVINSGGIKLFLQDGEEQKIVSLMKPGEVLGEMAIITGEPRTATAEATEHTEILVVDDNVLHSILNRCLPLVKSLMEQFINRIRETENKIKNGQFNFSAERCNRMEQTLRQIIQKTEEGLSAEGVSDAESKRVFSSIHESCLGALE